MASIKKRPNGKWRARYRDDAKREHTRHFAKKKDAQDWLDAETASLVTGNWTKPADRKVTVGEWCDQWIQGYGGRESTVRQAGVHLARIRQEFGDKPLLAVRPSMVKAWLTKLQDDGLSKSYVFALHNRLSQVMQDAVLDGILPANPCSRRTSPGAGGQVPYVATTEQIWALYDEFGERYRLAVLLGAFAGLRVGEASGLRAEDVDYLGRSITPAVQYPAEPLKTEMSRTTIPVARALATAISAYRQTFAGSHVLVAEDGGQLPPWKLEREMRRARSKVAGLDAGFRFQDLRHYFASLLIASGADVKMVQHRLRHASAKTTLDTYGHLWPDSDEATRTAVESVMSERFADSCGLFADSTGS